MKINIEKSQILTPGGPPLPPISLLLVRSYWNFHTICRIKKETIFVHENFSIYGLVFYISTNIYKYIYIYIYIYILKNRTSSVFMLEWKKNSFGILERFPTKYFFHFLFRFLLKTEKNEPLPLCPPFCPPFGGGGSSAASPLKNFGRNAPIPEYLKRLFEQKTEIW